MKARKVVWSAAAVDDPEETARYIAQDSPSTSRKIVAAIRDRGRRLGRHHSGRPGRVDGTFECVVPRLPWIIAYTITSASSAAEQIVIIRVIHGARDWPNESWPK